MDLPELAPPEQPLAPGRTPPWEQLPGESDRDYDRFCKFVQLGTTIKSTAGALDCSVRYLYTLAGRYRWVARREAYRAAETAERVSTHSERLTEGWAACLEWAIESVVESRARGDVLPPRDAVTLLRSASEALALLEGRATSRVELDLTSADLSKLDEIHEMLEKIP